MRLWTMREGKLYPVQYDDARIQQCIAIAEKVPGCHVDHFSGEVEGGKGALLTCLELSGDPHPWPVYEPEAEKLARLENPAILMPYQVDGTLFTADNLLNGVINHDDLGLGKTVQTIAALCLDKQCDVKLVLCPAFLRPQWEAEIRKWHKMFTGVMPRVAVLWPLSDKRSKKPQPEDPDWIVAYYCDAQRAVELAGPRCYHLVIDEIHNLRGLNTMRMEEVRSVSNFATGRLGLTASMLYNDGIKLWPLLDIVAPGAWGTRWQFAARYCGAEQGAYGMRLGELTNQTELRNRINLHSFRRTRQDVLSQLPFSTRYVTVELDPPKGSVQTLKSAALGGLADAHNHLRQVAMGKVEPVVQQVNSDRGAGTPSITFTYLKDQAKAIAAALPKSMLVTGEMDSAKRLTLIEGYVGQCRVLGVTPALVATMDSLSEGANLQWAKIVNFAALDLTPEKMRQCVGRAARMGQTGEVLIRIFKARNTIDEHIVQVCLRKLAEQFKLDGKREQSKSDLYDSLQPAGIKEVMTSLYEIMLAQEKSA